MPSTIEQLVEPLRPLIDVPGLEMLVGRTHRDESGKPPRIVWVHIGGSIQPIQFNGRVEHKIGDRMLVARPIYDDVVTVEAHIWAESEEAFDRLHQRVLSATKTLFGTASVPGQYVIDTEGARAGNVHAGETKATQLFQWRTRVARTVTVFQPGLLSEAGPKVPTQATVTILHQAHACTFDSTP